MTDHRRRCRGRDASCLAPPARIRTSAIDAYGSYLGWVTAKRWPLSARPSDPVTRVLRAVPGPRVPAGRSPWLTPFPPPSPLPRALVPLLCSTASSVLLRHPTPHCRACRSCGFRLLRPDCGFRLQSAMGSPGSRAYNFAACQGVSDYVGSLSGSRSYAVTACCLPLQTTGSATSVRGFRSSIPCPSLPLFMLRTAPHDARRKTRGQDGFAAPFLSDSFIPYCMPVYPGARSVPP